MRQEEKRSKRETGGRERSKGGGGLVFNSINSSKPDSHVIIKNHPISH